MLSLSGILEYLNDKSNKPSKQIERYKKVYYDMSLHIDGACPAYEDTHLGVMVYPTNYFGLEYQKRFQTTLFSKYPNESEETRNYRLSQYRPYQQEAFSKVIQVITGAIFQDSNYSLIVDDRNDNDYIWGENFAGKHLIAFISDNFVNICNDPNGRFVIAPKYSRLEQSEKVEPQIWFVPSTSILFISKDEFIFERDDTVWVVNKVGYFRYRKGDDDKYVIVEADGYYAHLLNRLPVYIAGGIWNNNAGGFYESLLNAAKNIADEFVGEKSLAQFVNKQSAHPFFIAASEDCPSCDNGKVIYCKKCHTDSSGCNCETPAGSYGEHWTEANCSSCGGNGIRQHDPAKWMIVPPEEMSNDLIKIVSTNPEVSKVQFENVKEVERRILRALHLNYIDEAQSGVAKDKDMETRYQFLMGITNLLFDDHLFNWIKDILALRNVRTENGLTVPDDGVFTIIKPTQFAIKTASQLLEEYKSALDANIPDYVLSRISEDYVDKQFGGDLLLKRKTELINKLDKIAVTPISKIQALLLNGGVTQRDLQFHVNLPLMLERIVREKGQEWLMSKPFEDIKIEVDRIFAEIAPPVLEINDTL